MRKLFIMLLLIVLMIPVLAQDEEEDIALMPDLSGLTAPEAESILNTHSQELRLDPIILSLDANSHEGAINTIGEQSIGADEAVEHGEVITISLIRDFNLLLIYRNETLRVMDNHFTMINLSDGEINIDGITLQSNERTFAASDWRASTIRDGQCFQLWSSPKIGNHQPAECSALAGVGILEGIPDNQQFWKDTDTFTVMQDGVYRASCEVAAGSCELWVSPQAIAEDVTEFAYFVYDEHQLYVYNYAPQQWMPLSEIRLADSERRLNDLQLWSSNVIPDINFLAPNQCVRFSSANAGESLADCLVIASSTLTQLNNFWSDGFIVHSLYQKSIEHTCPAPSGQTFCLVPRYELVP